MQEYPVTHYAPEPFRLRSPVCLQIEQIGTENFLDLLMANKSPEILSGSVLYGSDLSALTSTEAVFVRFRAPYTNSLILKSQDVPALEGMLTGTSIRRRMHRPLVGNAIIGKWHAGDNEVFKKLRILEEDGIVFDQKDTYLNLLMSLFSALHISDQVGIHFRKNTRVYSALLADKDLGVAAAIQPIRLG